MKRCDTFVFLDDVQINKESFTRRVQVRHPSKTSKSIWLTVPLKKHHHSALIKNVLIDHDQEWISKHLEVLKQGYHRSAQWNVRKDWLSDLYHSFRNMESLVEVNKASIKAIGHLLEINVRFVDSSSLDVFGEKDTYTYHLAEVLEATGYVRGAGEKKYSTFAGWENENALTIIDISIDDWKESVSNKYPNHEIGLSALDLLFSDAQSIDFTGL